MFPDESYTTANADVTMLALSKPVPMNEITNPDPSLNVTSYNAMTYICLDGVIWKPEPIAFPF